MTEIVAETETANNCDPWHAGYGDNSSGQGTEAQVPRHQVLELERPSLLAGWRPVRSWPLLATLPWLLPKMELGARRVSAFAQGCERQQMGSSQLEVLSLLRSLQMHLRSDWMPTMKPGEHVHKGAILHRNRRSFSSGSPRLHAHRTQKPP